MLKDLEAYYQDNGISPLDFRCQHWESCKKENEAFTESSGAFVSTGYEKGVLPRLLFLSLDSGSNDSEPDHRTMEFIRKHEENECEVARLPKQQHWYRTHELAWILLRQFRPNMTIQDSHLYFAHANSAKCSMNNRNKTEARPGIFKNCRRYVGGEVAILQPDILVTQGKWAKVAIEEAFKVPGASENELCSHRWVPIADRRTLWFHTYHPRNFGKFNQQRRECFNEWAEYVYGLFRK